MLGASLDLPSYLIRLNRGEGRPPHFDATKMSDRGAAGFAPRSWRLTNVF
jgi:hypothetical protein